MTTTRRPTPRSLRKRHAAPRLPRGDGFSVAQLHPSMIDGGMDPFLQIDAFALAKPFFAPHPHAGFSAVTYILPESPIGFVNRDTLGSHVRIPPGALHWTAAGRGVQHEEVPEVLGTVALGLQMFIDLPAAARLRPAFALHAERGEMPLVQHGGATVTVVFGSFGDAASAVPVPTPGAFLLDVQLAPGAVLEHVLPATDNAFVWMLDGSATVGETDTLQAFDFGGFANDGEAVSLRAGTEGARLLVAGGRPLGQATVASGPFVMSDAAQIADAVSHYRRGEMGRLDASTYGGDGRPVAGAFTPARFETHTEA